MAFTPPRFNKQHILWLATVVLITLNLRPFITSIGPMAPVLQEKTGISLYSLSWLTTLPMILMGMGTWLAPSIMHRFGPRNSLLGALSAIAIGCLLRMGANHTQLLLFTALLCGLGVAVVQGCLPGLIKWKSPQFVAPMMGIYSASLMGGGALGAQISPLAMELGASWQTALALWFWPVIIALALTWLQLTQAPADDTLTSNNKPQQKYLLKRVRTWTLIVFFGVMNAGYASTVAWLAPYYQEKGWAAAHSGYLVAVLSIAQAAAALSLPILAGRSTDRRPWIIGTVALQFIGFITLSWWPLAYPTFNAILLGMGLGGCFSLIMLIALDHINNPFQAGALSAFMQSGGFIIAAIGPWFMAYLHQFTDSFNAGWAVHMLAVVLLGLIALRFNPNNYAKAMKLEKENEEAAE